MTTDTTAGSVGTSQLEGEFRRIRAEFDTVPSPEQYVRIEALAGRIEVVMRPALHEGVCIDSESSQPVDPQLARQILTLADPRGWMLDAAQTHQAEIVAAVAPHTSWRSLDSTQRRALAYWRLLHPEFTYGTIATFGPPSARARLELNRSLRERGVMPGQPSGTLPIVIPAAVRDDPVVPLSDISEGQQPQPLPEPTEIVVVPVPVAEVPAYIEQIIYEPEPDSMDGPELEASEVPPAAAEPVAASAATPTEVAQDVAPAETPAEKLTLISRIFGKRAVVGTPMSGRPVDTTAEQADGGSDSDADEHIANRPVSGEAPDAAYAEADTIDEATLALLTADNMHPPKDAKGFIRFDPYGTDNSIAEAATAYFEKIELRISGGSMQYLSDKLAAFNKLAPGQVTDLPVGQYIWFPDRNVLQAWLHEAEA